MSDTRHEETESGGKFWPVFWIAIVSLLIFLGIHHWLNREPSYQGRRLSEWLDEMQTNDMFSATDEQKTAIQAMGARSVPFLIKILDKGAPRSRATQTYVPDALAWISGQLHIHLWEDDRQRRQNYAQAAFESLIILGPQAKSGISYFDSLFDNPSEELKGVGGFLLAKAGSAAIPTLTNRFNTTNQQTQFEVLVALGEMGSAGKSMIPFLSNVMSGTNIELARQVVLDLSEMGDDAKPFIPKFEAMLNNADYRAAAAYTLGRLDQRRQLALALANDDPDMASAAYDGLMASIQNELSKKPEHFYVISLEAYGNPARSVVNSFHPKWATLLNITPFLKDPDPGVRTAIINFLGRAGVRAWATAPLISKALSDDDEMVRQKAAEALKKIDVTLEEGGIIRGPRREKKIALEFTGHSFAEGGETFLNELEKHHAKGSFFLTGDFLRNPEFTNLTRRILIDGHYIGSHSNKHPLYCPWEGPKTNLISSNVFNSDLKKSEEKLWEAKQRVAPTVYPNGITASDYWLPPFEWYNQDIVNWSRQMGLALVNYTPGTRSNADYTQDTDTNFVSSQAIFDSIVKKEREDPDGLNGFLLLFHLGAGPGRTDKFSARFGELLDYLSARGYQFVRIDEMMEGR